MNIFVSAGESSSDIHCARVIRELKNHAPDLKSFGLGGAALSHEGTDLMMHNREFSVMGGPLEVIGLLPKRRRLERMLEERLFKTRPDLALLVDNGEINLRLASLLHFFGVPVVYYIPPKIWVWRHSRIEKIAQHVRLVLSILPFEKPMYDSWEIPFEYVGNPLVDELPMDLSVEAAKKELGLDPSKTYIAVFPGSRHSEIKYHTELFADSLKIFFFKLREKYGDKAGLPEVLIPVAPAVDAGAVRADFEKYLAGSEIKVHFFLQSSHLCLKASRAAIVKSGTSTLEAAVLQVPMILSYRSSGLSTWMFKHIARYRGFIGMANLFLVEPASAALGLLEKGEKRPCPPIPELVLEKCNPEFIGSGLFEIYEEGPVRDKMLSELKRTKELIYPPKRLGVSPAKAVADAIRRIHQEDSPGGFNRSRDFKFT